MMKTTMMTGLCLSAGLLIAGGAFAQSASDQPSPGSSAAAPQTSTGGTGSDTGPATGNPATLGTGNTATPHQKASIRHRRRHHSSSSSMSGSSAGGNTTGTATDQPPTGSGSNSGSGDVSGQPH